MSASIAGEWTLYQSEMTHETRNVFEKATKDIYGVRYQPVAFAAQVVEGVNYSFFCNAAGIYPGKINQPAIIDVCQKPGGVPYVTGIRLLEP